MEIYGVRDDLILMSEPLGIARGEILGTLPG